MHISTLKLVPMKDQKGFKGIGSNAGQFVPAEDAFTVAAQAVGIIVFNHTADDAEEFREMLVEWYFSGNWVEVEGDD